MNELPWWVTLRDPDSVYASVLRELWGTEDFAEHVQGALNAPGSDRPFILSVGGRDLYDNMPEPVRKAAPWDDALGAVTILNGDGNSGGIALDMERIASLARGDSAQARQLVRDALLHEFGHVLPVARSRSMKDRTFDPKPGAANVADHPVIQNENKLRGLLGLPEKTFYGLLNR